MIAPPPPAGEYFHVRLHGLRMSHETARSCPENEGSPLFFFFIGYLLFYINIRGSDDLLRDCVHVKQEAGTWLTDQRDCHLL